MQLEKIYEKVKKYLLLIEEDDIEKKKIEKLTKNIEEKISKIKNKLKFVNDIGDENRLKEEMAILKKFKKQLKKKKQIKDKQFNEMNNVEIAKYFSFFISFINTLKTPTCLKYIGAKAPKKRNANTE